MLYTGLLALTAVYVVGLFTSLCAPLFIIVSFYVFRFKFNFCCSVIPVFLKRVAFIYIILRQIF